MNKSTRIPVAKIATAHGVRGLVKLHISAEDPHLLESGRLYADEHTDKTYKLTLKNPIGRYWIAAIDDINDRTAAETLRHTTLWIDKNVLPETAEGEYYAADLVGLRAVDAEGVLLGTVIAVPDFGASPLLEIKPDGQSSFYLPFTKHCVPHIDFKNGTLTAFLPEGLA